MHQTKKGNQWHFGMKAHIGGVATPAQHGRCHAGAGKERLAFGEAGYQGVEKREENQASTVKWLFGLANLLTVKRQLFALLSPNLNRLSFARFFANKMRGCSARP